MAVTGIIAEFNPLHNGHKLLIDRAKEQGDTVICVISGNLVQRGDTSVIPKLKRAEAALLCGADVVAELPVLWSMSTAQNFALGGVSQLYNLGCDKIIFGSECGDINSLINAADILLSDEFAQKVSDEVKSGITFAAARSNAAEILGVNPQLLSNPNDNLGIEYIMAAKTLNLPITFTCVKRLGAGHDSNENIGGLVSSSFIRQKILEDNLGYAERFMPIPLRGFIKEDFVSDIKRIENAILGILRLKSSDDFKALPDLSEGIENKLYFSLRVATSLDELYNMIKTKRYTLARVRRLVLSAALGFDGELFMTPPPYVRVLGFSEQGEKQIRKLEPTVPVITRATQIKELDERCKKVFETECRATDLYALSLSKPLECGLEYKMKLLKGV